MQLALGHYTRFYAGSSLRMAFQNFYIGETHSDAGVTYLFLPFGFSGMGTNRQGDNTTSTLVFPNNQLARDISDEALREAWVMEVDVKVLDPDTRSVQTTLYTFVGQASSSGWDESGLRIELNTLLDAVGGEVPIRTLHQKLVGALPYSNNVRLR